MQNNFKMILSKLKRLVIKTNVKTKHVSNFLAHSEVAILNFGNASHIPHILTVRMCEMFPVKRKPGINLDTVFLCDSLLMWCMSQGRGPCHYSLRGGGEVVQEKKASPNSHDGLLVVISCASCVCVQSREGHLCVCVFICVCLLGCV